MKPDKIFLFLSVIMILTALSWISSCTHNADITDLPEICFEGDVLPIFTNSCAMAGCHDGGGESHMRLNNYVDISHSVVPGSPYSSRSYKAIITTWGENKMPPDRPLSLENRTIIRLWIEQGARLTLCNTTGTNNGSGEAGNGTSRACFSRDILPVLVSRCATAGCHDALTHAEGHIYTSYSTTMTSVTPGSPSNSRMYHSIKVTSGEERMPPAGKPQLTAVEIDSIGKWIGYGALNETCLEGCDTINPVTFSGTIWPIMQKTCTGCHSGTTINGGIALETYSNVKAVATNGTLMNSLRGTGVTKMPQGGSFSTCRIRQFEIWVKGGSLNN